MKQHRVLIALAGLVVFAIAQAGADEGAPSTVPDFKLEKAEWVEQWTREVDAWARETLNIVKATDPNSVVGTLDSLTTVARFREAVILACEDIPRVTPDLRKDPYCLWTNFCLMERLATLGADCLDVCNQCGASPAAQTEATKLATTIVRLRLRFAHHWAALVMIYALHRPPALPPAPPSPPTTPPGP